MSMDEIDPTPEPTAALRGDLSRLYRPHIEIPSEVDARMREAARRRFVQRRVTRPTRRWAAVAAAALLVITGGWWWITQHRPADDPPTLARRADVDASGTVDILDAFHLARHIEAGSRLQLQWDMTGDRRVDRDDVDHIAKEAVRLK